MRLLKKSKIKYSRKCGFRVRMRISPHIIRRQRKKGRI